MPAEIVRGHTPGHPENTMHGGAPRLVVALFDASNWTRIENAKVTARISPLGTGGPSRILQPMRIAGTTSYGEYFPMPQDKHYTIHIEIERPGAAHRTTADFMYEGAER